MVEAFTLPVTLEMAGKPLLQQMGRSGRGNALSGHSGERTDGDVRLLLGQQDTWTGRLHIYNYASEPETLGAIALYQTTRII